MTRSSNLRSVAFILASSFSSLFLTQCKTTGTYKDVNYDPSKLKTPAGHGLERKDYPFDENGAYRKDWVKANSGGRDPSASPATAAASDTSGSSSISDASGSSSGPTSYPTYAESSAARSGGGFVGPAGEEQMTHSGAGLPAATVSPVSSTVSSSSEKYHKVSSGDTLFALAGRYGTSVSELKRVNGLKSDSIRVGQSLRIP